MTNKCSLGEQKRLFKNKNLTDTKLLKSSVSLNVFNVMKNKHDFYLALFL